MSGAGFLWLEKLTGNGIIRKAAKHNKREIQAEFGASGSIDSARSRLNYSLVGPATAGDVGQLAKDLMTAAGVVKTRKNGVLGIEVIFSLPPGHLVDDRAYFQACADWAGRYFGGADNILSFDVHHDEAQLHAHAVILPLLNGRMDASSMVGNTQKLLAMQDQFHTEVAQLYGLQKPSAKLSGTAKRLAAQKVLQAMRNTGDSALKSAAWASIRSAITNDPGPFLLTYGLEPDAPIRKMKTMAQIFTSTGKGPAKEKFPIENLKAEKETSLLENSEPGKKILYLCVEKFKITPSFQPPNLPTEHDVTQHEELSNIPNADGEIAAPTKGASPNLDEGARLSRNPCTQQADTAEPDVSHWGTNTAGTPDPSRLKAITSDRDKPIDLGEDGDDPEKDDISNATPAPHAKPATRLQDSMASLDPGVTTRHRDNENEVNHWDPDRGEFVVLTAARRPTRSEPPVVGGRDSADRWVASKLAARSAGPEPYRH